ncbi:pyruvate kinase [Corynebacterium breve]|uniref:pyruvate kinase n=1 Tax=Corynebacterium breve TaxID=3049799 RepID=A0ABY8VIZ7_9CORY|nr:pyruvate kinase [Corynebacterium breve]WIM67535.1 pyruvate kinase [Corynebacterium breve]
MQEFVKELITQLDTVISNVEKEAEHQAEAIDKVAETHADGARNLVHYTALRNQELRKLQAGLSSVGATRLTTTEPAVLARLEAAHNVLDAYAGNELTYPAKTISDAFARADDILEEHADALFGPTSEETHSRIMVTLPAEAADDFELVKGFAEAGMELARINCAHDGLEAWERMIANVHEAASAVGREIRVAMDLAGPKVRTGEIEPGPAVNRARVTRTAAGEVTSPAKLYLSAIGSEVPTPPEEPGRPGVNLQVDPAWLENIEVGSVISLRDNRNSKRRFTVRDVREDGLVIAHGNQNAYIANTTMLEHNWERTRVSGVEPIEVRIRLHAGDCLVLTTSQEPAKVIEGQTTTIGCTAPEAVTALEVGHNVLFDDGSIAAVVVEKRKNGEHDEAVLEVTRAGANGVNLAAYKGINLPDTDIPLPSLTDEDLAAFEFVAHNADIANVSFIRTAADVANVLENLERIANEAPEKADRIRNLGIVLKIETIPAYEQLASVLLEGMRHPKLGIMVARGDLAVELGFARMAEVPRLIMQMAEAAHVPVIMATQILENLAKTGLPSRAEMTDAGYALRAECVMLNKGPHITDAIRILEEMSSRLGRSQRKNRQMLRRIGSWENAL